MRSTYPSPAGFDPIPPELDLPKLVEETDNFKWAQRVSRSQMQELGQREFEDFITSHVVIGGKPLVIEGWEDVLPADLFNVDWLEATYDKKRM